MYTMNGNHRHAEWGTWKVEIGIRFCGTDATDGTVRVLGTELRSSARGNSAVNCCSDLHSLRYGCTCLAQRVALLEGVALLEEVCH